MKEEELLLRVQTQVERINLPGYGWDEVQFLARTVFELRPTFICEWGTNRGSSARVFYEATRYVPNPPTIYTIELPFEQRHLDPDHPGIQVGMFVYGISRVQRSHGDGVTVGLEFYGKLQPERALFFVDGNHDCDQVIHELFALMEYAPDAVIVLHDTNHPDAKGPTGPAEALRTLKGRIDERYEAVELLSQAGMVRLWPR